MTDWQKESDTYANTVAVSQRFHGEIHIGEAVYETVTDAVRVAFIDGWKRALTSRAAARPEPPEQRQNASDAAGVVERAVQRALNHFAEVEATWREELKSGPKAKAWQARAEGHLTEAHDAQVYLREIQQELERAR